MLFEFYFTYSCLKLVICDTQNFQTNKNASYAFQNNYLHRLAESHCFSQFSYLIGTSNETLLYIKPIVFHITRKVSNNYSNCNCNTPDSIHNCNNQGTRNLRNNREHWLLQLKKKLNFSLGKSPPAASPRPSPRVPRARP